MADPTAAAKAARAEDQKAVEKSRADYNEKKIPCTPTQEEVDLIKLGAPVLHKRQGGGAISESPPRQMETRQMESGSRGDYMTRASRSSPSSPSPSQPSPQPAAPKDEDKKPTEKSRTE